MHNQIEFNITNPNKMPASMGRNGTILTAGVRIDQVLGDELWLRPVTSKGSVGRCVLSLPADPEVLHRMAATLMMEAENLRDAQATAQVA